MCSFLFFLPVTVLLGQTANSPVPRAWYDLAETLPPKSDPDDEHAVVKRPWTAAFVAKVFFGCMRCSRLRANENRLQLDRINKKYVNGSRPDQNDQFGVGWLEEDSFVLRIAVHGGFFFFRFSVVFETPGNIHIHRADAPADLSVEGRRRGINSVGVAKERGDGGGVVDWVVGLEGGGRVRWVECKRATRGGGGPIRSFVRSRCLALSLC